MPARFWSALLIAVVGTVVVTFYFTREMFQASAPNLENPDEWTLVKFFRKERPGQGELTIHVYLYKRLSGQGDPYTVMQNKIVVNENGADHVFMWPEDREYAGGWCEILELAKDGSIQILLYWDTTSLRVLTYANGKFSYRPDKDDLLSLEYDLFPRDLDGDGKYEFLDGNHVGELGGRGPTIPHVKQWTAEQGFVDVCSRFPAFFGREVLPRLKLWVTTEKDERLRRNCEKAIEHISQKSSSGP